MRKKFLSVMVLVAALIFIGGQEKVFAYDVYCGTFSDGSEAYLMTETVQYSETEWYAHYTCRVKVLQNGSLLKRLDYAFTAGEGGGVMFVNSEGNGGVFGGRRMSNPYPIANEIFTQASKIARGR